LSLNYWKLRYFNLKKRLLLSRVYRAYRISNPYEWKKASDKKSLSTVFPQTNLENVLFRELEANPFIYFHGKYFINGAKQRLKISLGTTQQNFTKFRLDIINFSFLQK
jgi:hypothetical protein